MYEWNPSEYKDNSANQKQWGDELLSGLELKGNESILDIGCGDGRLTASLAALVPRGLVIGVDNSVGMVELARTSYPPERHPNLKFETRDARELDVEDDFDVIFSNACLHWVIDHQNLLGRFSRALKPGGILLVQMGGQGNGVGIFEAADRVMARPEWKGYFSGFVFPYGFYGPTEYLPWLENAGFSVQRLELISKEMAHAGEDKLRGWVRTTWMPFTERIPEPRRENFIAEITKEYLKDFPAGANGIIHLGMKRLEIRAVKPV